MRILTFLLLLYPALLSAAERVDPKAIVLSKDMEERISRGEQFAASVLSDDFKRFSTDSGQSIVITEIANTMERLNAEARAGKVYGYLAADIDWDGEVTRSELELHLVGRDPNFVEGFLRDGDLDGDGVIQLSEMMEDAQLELPARVEPDRSSVREMLNWDLDKNGILEWAEILDVIAANQ